MPNFGFVINNRTCIGCHACSTACKAENEVPLGVARTWVKYTEVGAYPDVRRNFQVTRCNHCANPPCVRICPVSAMYQRSDGIVEFDQDACIGCKACLQACPYDAIHIDPDSGTAAKCHYCAHRTDLGLEPACVVVCPEHAIISGDMDDPDSEISRVLAREQVTVRKPEQGTAPKLFYVDGNDFALVPTATPRTPETFMWADVVPLEGEEKTKPRVPAAARSLPNAKAESGVGVRRVQAQGHPEDGPISYAPGRMAEHMVQVGYNAQHLVPWHWPVPAYLVTKGIGGGLFALLALGVLLGLFPADPGTFVAGGFFALVMVGLTTALLVYDLERPERFLRVLTRPQWRSWLTRGAYLLVGFTLVAGAWWVVELFSWWGLVSPSAAASFRPWALALGLPLALGVITYTAFLFGQAEGRDLWQSPLLPVHLLIQATMMGGAALLLLSGLFGLPSPVAELAGVTFAVGLVLDLGAILLGELGMPHATEVAAAAAHRMSRGKYRKEMWLGGVVLGHAVPLTLLGVGWGGIAALAAGAGLYFYEHAYVLAPQEIPNS